MIANNRLSERKDSDIMHTALSNLLILMRAASLSGAAFMMEVSEISA